MADHPPCGLYRTTLAQADVPAGRLVYFHNHGDPGPGIYTPHRWVTNRVEWHERGVTTDDPAWTTSLAPLPAEGLYRVRAAFHCCPKECVHFEAGLLVQLGYTFEAQALIFVPEWAAGAMAFPEQGTRVDEDRLGRLDRLTVREGAPPPGAAGRMVH